jgi:hypothetical protein
VTVVASSNDRRPSGLFVLASLQALHLDRGSGPAGIAATKESGGERAWPLIMTWCPDKRAVNKAERR